MKNSGDFSFGSEVWPGTSKLIEEMGELQQVLGKLLGTAGERAHWDGTDLRERLMAEIADLTAALSFFMKHNMSEHALKFITAHAEMKFKLFEKWHEAGRAGDKTTTPSDRKETT